MDNVHIKEGSLIARIAAFVLKTHNAAIVIGNVIYIHGVHKEAFLSDKRWLLHELQHVVQYNREGVGRFIFQYIFNHIKFGYSNNPYEVEARNAETDETLLDKYKIL